MSRSTKGGVAARWAFAFGAATWFSASSAHAQAPAAPSSPTTGVVNGDAAASQFPECTRQPSEPDVDGAKGAHKAATQFFERGDYDRAIQYWRDAYGFDCSRPPLLLNIASAYEKKGDKAAAVSVLELFLTRASDSPDAPTVREKVANLRAALDAERLAAGPPPPPPVVVASPPPPEERKPERPFGVAPWVVVGIGSAVSLVGLVPLIIGTGKISDAELACPVRSGCDDAVAEQGNTGRTLVVVGDVMVPLGLLTVGGGLVWQLAWNQERPVDEGAAASPRAGAELIPVVGSDFQGAVLTGAF